MKKIKHLFMAILAMLAMVVTGSVAGAQTVTGNNGNGTITITNASQGQTYTVYKLFDATVGEGGAISYKVPQGKTVENTNTWFQVDAKGNVSAKENADVSTEAFRTWAEGFGAQVATAKAEDNTLVFAGLAYGYYFVKSSLNTTLTVDSTNPNATVIDKNTTSPNIPDGGGKKIVLGNNLVSETTAKVGDVIDYQITFNATNHVTKANGETKQITEYTITDKRSNLTINNGTLAVKVDEKVLGTDAYTVTDKDGVMTIVIPWATKEGKSIYNSPSAVVITYKATVKGGAANGGATNAATITYDGNTIPGDNTTKVTTHRFTLNKTSKENGSDTLQGAQFRLYDAKGAEGKEIAVVKDGNDYRVAEAGETGVVIEAGKVIVKGLKGDTKYYLEEIKAPNGYNLLDGRKEVTVTKDDKAEVNVVNKAGVELPATGSFGTTMFYLAGSALLVGALVYMISKRRMNNL